jgi:hypothetical protein
VTICLFCTDTVADLADVASPRLNRHRYDFPRQVTDYGEGEREMGTWKRISKCLWNLFCLALESAFLYYFDRNYFANYIPIPSVFSFFRV